MVTSRLLVSSVLACFIVWGQLLSQVCSFCIHQQPSHIPKCRSITTREGQWRLWSTNEEMKEELLKRIDFFRMTKTLAGKDVQVDWGTKGGELNQTSRAPQKVDFYSISDSTGYAADAILEQCETLATTSPISNATMFLGDRNNGEKAPLNGAWKLLFSTAADATFSKNSTRGGAKVQNVVNARKGKITNVIDFLPSSSSSKDGTQKPPLLKQLNVVIKAIPLSEKRVQLEFKYAKVVFSRLFFFPIQWNLFIPVPATFITRVLVFFNRLLRRRKAQMPPQAYFDVIYLDDDLRIHKTGEDNIFVQARESWSSAQRLLD